MDKKIELKDNQYSIDGEVKLDVELVNEVSKWVTDNFIFRGNDIFLPNVPFPLSAKNITKYKDLKVETFASKYGNVALKYLVYNIFLLGYEAGKEREKIDEKENIEKDIDEMIDKSVPIKKVEKTKEEIKEDKIKEEVDEESKIETSTVSKDEDEIVEELKPTEEVFINKEELISKEEEIEESEEDEEDENLVEVDENGKAIHVFFSKDKKLVVKSSIYSNKTLEKVLCIAIEKRLNIYGITMDDIENTQSPVPSFILGEILIDIEEIQAVTDEQKETKDLFYNYFKNLQEKITKSNTIS